MREVIDGSTVVLDPLREDRLYEAIKDVSNEY